MSSRAIAWALDASCSGPMSAEGRLVLLVLADHAGPDGASAWPSKRSVATRLGVSERTVQRALKSLREAGAIVLGDQSATNSLPADKRPTVYDLPIGETLVAPRGESEVTPRYDSGETDVAPAGRQIRSSGVPDLSPKPRTEPTTQTPSSPSKVTSPGADAFAAACPDCNLRGWIDYQDEQGYQTTRKCTHPNLERPA